MGARGLWESQEVSSILTTPTAKEVVMATRRRKRHTGRKQRRAPACRKRRYPSQAAAEQDIPTVEALDLSKPAKQRRKGPLHTYVCEKCETWHIGHVNPKLMKASIE